MLGIEDFGETGDVAITVLIDNRTDLLAKSTDTVKYWTDDPLIAEHGFAAWVDLKAAGVRILWDTGATRFAVLENMKRLRIDPAAIDKIALSHGHEDHTSGVTEVLRAMDLQPKPREWKQSATPEELRRYAEGRRVPVFAHPAVFRERWRTPADGPKHGPIPPPPRREWEAAGAEVVLSEGPYPLAPGCWTTGAIPRRSFETAGISAAMSYREGETLIRDDVVDDQAIIVNVKEKGLVIVSGCAHAGIVNTIHYARAISGVNEVWAVIGGFHLAKATDGDIQRTIDEVKQLKPKTVAPAHCTGFKAMTQFALALPDEFTQALVGMTCLF